jgi:hypothetical protein
VFEITCGKDGYWIGTKELKAHCIIIFYHKSYLSAFLADEYDSYKHVDVLSNSFSKLLGDSK